MKSSKFHGADALTKTTKNVPKQEGATRTPQNLWIPIRARKLLLFMADAQIPVTHAINFLKRLGTPERSHWYMMEEAAT